MFNKSKIIVLLVIFLVSSFLLILSIILFSFLSTERNKNNILDLSNQLVWELDLPHTQILIEDGLVVSINSNCEFQAYNLENGEKVANQNFEFTDMSNCKDINFYSQPVKSNDSLYIFRLSLKGDEYIVQFNVKESKFSWINEWSKNNKPPSVAFFDDKVVAYDSNIAKIFNSNNGKLLNTFNFTSNKRTVDQEQYDSMHFREIDKKSYLYITKSDKYLALNLSDNKIIYQKSPYQLFNINEEASKLPPELEFLDNKIALGVDKDFVYLVDLSSGNLKKKISKNEFVSLSNSTIDLKNFAYYTPFVYKNYVFLYTSNSEKGPTFVVDYNSGELVKTYNASRLTILESQEGLLANNNWRWLALIDKNNFNIIWEQDIDNFSNIKVLDDHRFILTQRIPDSHDCLINCDDSVERDILEIKTGNKLDNINKIEAKLNECDYIYNNYCLKNNSSSFGYSGFTVYDKNEKKVIVEKENINTKSYLYKNLIIYNDCNRSKDNENLQKSCSILLKAAKLDK